ncbi:PP2C family protein-serine/threonine phosphatase [Paracoccus aerodenitrificans]|uniref:PP2C family protein-serine/threonine phosphatase n=1 Tax=Paracoccus aerodenitrificans TaxID=3017781 RepID=UPI0022F01949|nr:fused response regulator/phosphatase [Paracoccus aerodenitrificans]WBU63714.1 fused response regulator/phosphatase [Paracoccus aerodenitrificans]
MKTNPISTADSLVPVSARRVLVVDDSRAQRMMLSIHLNRAGYEVLEAESGDAALEICRTQRPDVILSDWVMAGMTGPDLCREIRSRHWRDYIYFILITSKADPADIAFGLESGADDFLTKPIAAAELLARLRAGERILRLQDDARRANAKLTETLSQLRSAQASMDRDLTEARRLQQGLIGNRQERFGDFAVSNILRPAGHVGGDLTGSFAINARRFGVFSIDVSGHGVTAALLTARLATQFSSSVDQNAALFINEFGLYDSRPPAALARYLNHLLLTDLQTDNYFTMVFAIVDQITWEVCLVQAGHPYPLLQRVDGSVEQIGKGGLPVGVMEHATYDEISLKLKPGERLLIASDGLSDVTDRAGQALGTEGLSAILSADRNTYGVDLLETMVGAVLSHSNGEQCDDMSAVLLEHRASGHGSAPKR